MIPGKATSVVSLQLNANLRPRLKADSKLYNKCVLKSNKIFPKMNFKHKCSPIFNIKEHPSLIVKLLWNRIKTHGIKCIFKQIIDLYLGHSIFLGLNKKFTLEKDHVTFYV